LKFFKVDVHQIVAPKIIELFWQPPLCNWMKCNTDGTALGSPGQVSCVGLFMNSHEEHIGCFTMNLGIVNALYVEIMGVILAIEFVVQKNWNHLWIESDSRLACMAFKSPLIFPWEIKTDGPTVWLKLGLCISSSLTSLEKAINARINLSTWVYP
jgi:hypothetical protein